MRNVLLLLLTLALSCLAASIARQSLPLALIGALLLIIATLTAAVWEVRK
jgi:hypothetical protein